MFLIKSKPGKINVQNPLFEPPLINQYKNRFFDKFGGCLYNMRHPAITRLHFIVAVSSVNTTVFLNMYSIDSVLVFITTSR